MTNLLKMHAYQKYAAKRIYDEPSVGLFLDMGLRQNDLNAHGHTSIT